jgi:hypothetical protein
MADLNTAIRLQLRRQVEHWTAAASRLADADELAPAAAWRQLELYLDLTVRRELAGSAERLSKHAALLTSALSAASSLVELEAVNRLLLQFRHRYLRTEMTLEFFANAIRTRTDAALGALLRACDTIAYRSMALVLDQLDKRTPAALTYLVGGLGASVLKAGLPLWDGTDCPVAAIKVTRHNLYGVSLLHESGHQIAQLTGWTEELASAFRVRLTALPAVTDIWAGWTSEIVADTHAFVHAGFASVATLHDVVAGEDSVVFRHIPGDPHPIPYLRVLLGVELCRQCYGTGPWDDLAIAWRELHDLRHAEPEAAALIRASLPVIPQLAELCLRQPMRGFRGRCIADLVNPERVGPSRLLAMEAELGNALYTSTHWIWTEALRLLALGGLRIATTPARAAEIISQQQAWMLRLGGQAQAA